MTANSPGYAITSQAPIGFNPKTGDLWYINSQGSNGSSQYGYVNPKIGPRSNQLVNVMPLFKNNALSDYSASVFFAPTGWGPISTDWFTVDGNIYLPGGTQVDRSALSGFQVGPYGKVNDTSPTRPVSPSIDVPSPVLAVSSDSFLAMNLGKTQLYFCTIGIHSVSVKALLPPSSRQLIDVGIDPSRTTASFIASSGSEYSLFTVSLSSQSQPTLVTNLNPNIGAGYRLLAWVS